MLNYCDFEHIISIKIINEYFTFFSTLSLQNTRLYFAFTEHVNLYQPHSKCLRASCGQWLLNWVGSPELQSTKPYGFSNASDCRRDLEEWR